MNVIMVVPAVIPATIPVREPTVAVAVVLLVQVPAPLASLSAVVLPVHTVVVPVIGDGTGTTFTVVVALHRPPNEYVITAVQQAEPVVPPIVTLPVVPLTQLPPAVASLKVMQLPLHILVPPVIAAGVGYTVIVIVR